MVEMLYKRYQDFDLNMLWWWWIHWIELNYYCLFVVIMC